MTTDIIKNIDTVLYKEDGTEVHMPEVSEDDYQFMHDKKKDEGIYAFPFVHTNPFPYIEIFIWDNGKPQRFILSEGLHMSPKHEKNYLGYARKENINSYDDCFWFTLREKLNIPCFEHFNYHGHCDNYIRLSLEHLFYCTYQQEYSGKAILYKEGLDIIGYNADKIPWLNLNGNDIDSVLREKIPAILLETLNQDGLVERLYNKESLQQAKKIYHKYRKYIDEANGSDNPLTSLVQWIYLERLNEKHIRFDSSVRKVLLYITNLSNDIEVLDQYEEFLSLRREMKQRYGYKFKIPDYWHIRQKLSGIKDVYKIRKNLHPEIDIQIKKRNRTSTEYEYVDEEGFRGKIVLPNNLAEVFEALNSLKLPLDELKTLVLEHISGEVILLLMKSEGYYDPEILHALLLIKDNTIKVKVIGGEIPSKSPLSFNDYILSFTYKYSQKKGLQFDLPEDYTPFDPAEVKDEDNIDEIIAALKEKYDLSFD